MKREDLFKLALAFACGWMVATLRPDDGISKKVREMVRGVLDES